MPISIIKHTRQLTSAALAMTTTDTPAVNTGIWCSRKAGERMRPIEDTNSATKKWVMGSAGAKGEEGNGGLLREGGKERSG